MRTARQVRHDAKRLWRLCLVNGSLDESRVRQVVDRVIETRRSGGVTILSHCLRLLKGDRAPHAAQVDSAAPLDADARAAAQEGRPTKAGPILTTTFVV